MGPLRRIEVAHRGFRQAAGVADLPPPPPLPRWWVVAVVLPLMAVSDYKIRSRDSSQTISGAPDLVVVLEVLIYGGVALWLMSTFRWRPRVREAPHLMWAAWAFAGLYALTALWSPFPLLALVRAAQLLVIASVGQAIAGHATKADLDRLVHGFLLLVLAGVSFGLVLPSTQLENVRRFTWLAVHPVLSGTYLSLGMVVATACLVVPALRWRRGAWSPEAYAGLLLVFGLALLSNRTRGALVAALVGVTVVLFTGVRRRDRAAVPPGIALAALAFGAAVGQSRLVEYVARGDAAKLTSLNYRTTLWTEALREWQEAPLTGQGLGATRGVFLESTGLGGGHNALINVLVDAGLVGALAWTLLLIVLVWRTLQLPGHLVGGSHRAMLLGLLACLLVNGITTEGLGQSANCSMILLLVLCGWVFAAGRWTAPDGQDAAPVPVPLR